MRVLLSGFNLDRTTIEELRNFISVISEKLNHINWLQADALENEILIKDINKKAIDLLQKDNLTPETLSAAYARISRNPKPIDELREIARQEIELSRKSNKNIIFGLGHSSVAEHAVFNFDIIGVSRLAVETIEHFRLASYTEKSQRYILFKDDFIVPEELKTTKLMEEYCQLIQEQNKTYFKLYEVLKPHFLHKYPELSKNAKNISRLEGLAKEDARYVIPLATQTQLGMTVNARTLENMISKCLAHPLSEIREYAKQLYQTTEGIAPSIIKYTTPSPFLLNKKVQLKTFFRSHLKNDFSKDSIIEKNVQLIEYPENADEQILSIILFHLKYTSFESARQQINHLTYSEKYAFYQTLFDKLNSWDSLLREFEFIYFAFQLNISAGNFGQLKRHRMANIITQDYDLNLGVTIPPSIIETRQQSLFNSIINRTNTFYEKLYQKLPTVAPYILTNSHKRRVLFKINLREFYHFSRLREDQHAQWDIRQIAEQMRKLVSDKMPLCGALLGGKDRFQNQFERFKKVETF
jgi:flavin-dependent thymidylate synthase